MKAAISLASMLACTFSLDAQITAISNPQPDGLPEIRIRNNSAVSLVAFAISVSYVNRSSVNDDPLMVYVDPAIDTVPAINIYTGQRATGPVLPNQEFTWLPERMVVNPKSGESVLKEPIITAGIFADGTTTGDAALLTRLMLRRSNMLLSGLTAMADRT